MATDIQPHKIRQSTIRRHSGKKYARLTVQSFSHTDKHGQHFFVCQCDCGTIKPVRLVSVIGGHTKSCGCYWAERLNTITYPERRLLPGESGLNWTLRRYIIQARRRKIRFHLTREQFRQITSANCYYCGAPPAQERRNTRQFGVFVYNGVDRVDNSVGYVMENCVSCCGKCNTAKGAITKQMIYQLYHRFFPA